MKASTILGLATLLVLAACDHPDTGAAPTEPAEAAASDNSAFLEAGSQAASAAPLADAPPLAPPPVERGPPPEVPPVVRDGIRYAQGEDGRDPGLAQASGMLVVSDELSGKRLWTLAVYGDGAGSAKTADARWVFFKSMAFDPDGRLRIVDEAGRNFLVDIRRRSSAPVAPN